MYQLGFDIGGTSIKAGIVHDSMEIVARRSIPFPLGEGCEAVAARMAGMAREMEDETGVRVSDFKTVGAAVPGAVDALGEVVLNAYNLGFHNAPLKAALEAQFPDNPVFIANDANAAGLAEYHAGAFRGCKTALLLTLGTGLGGGMVINGKIWNGGQNRGFEPGHFTLVHGGELCTCGNHGCAEVYCSATWLVHEGHKALTHAPASMITQAAKSEADCYNMKRKGEGEAMTAKHVMSAKIVLDAAKDGDSYAMDIFDRYVGYLGSAIASFVALFDPEKIALGGGVSLTGEFLFEPLRSAVQRKCFFKPTPPIVAAEMGNDAGIVGASMLGR